MKAVVCLMCIVAVTAKPMNLWRTAGNGQYVMTYDNSFENGFRDVSLEWVRRPGPGAAGGGGLFRSHTQKVEDLTRMLNSGMMDRSDEFLLRAVMENPERFGNRPYIVDASGEVKFLAHGSQGGVAGGPAVGGPAGGPQQHNNAVQVA